MNLCFRNYGNRLLLIALRLGTPGYPQGLCQRVPKGSWTISLGFRLGDRLSRRRNRRHVDKRVERKAFEFTLSSLDFSCEFRLEIAIVDSMELFHRGDIDPLAFRMEVPHERA